MLTTDRQILTKRLELILQHLEIQELTLQQQEMLLMTIQNSINATIQDLIVMLGSDALGDIYYRGAEGKLTRLPIGNEGQVLVVDSTGIPKWVTSKALSYEVITTASKQAESNKGYIVAAGSAVTITLPTTPQIGDEIRVVGKGSSLWSIVTNSGQFIDFGNKSTGSGLTATHSKDSVILIATEVPSKWSVISAVGNIFVVES